MDSKIAQFLELVEHLKIHKIMVYIVQLVNLDIIHQINHLDQICVNLYKIVKQQVIKLILAKNFKITIIGEYKNNFMKCQIKFIIQLIWIKIVQLHFKTEVVQYVKKDMKWMKVCNVFKLVTKIVLKVIIICLLFIQKEIKLIC